MAQSIKQGQSIYIPFVNGESVFDSQNRPRMYKSVNQFQKSYPAFRLENPELVEYAPVVHGKWVWNPNGMDFGLGSYECSVCYCRNNSLPMDQRMNPLMFSGSKYCPNCGAKMDQID